MYKIDNRPRKNRKGVLVIGIVLGISLAVGGMFIYQNYHTQIRSDFTQVTPKIQEYTDTIQKASNSITNGVIPQNKPSYSLDELRKVALDSINQDRSSYGLKPLVMENAGASQIWADHLLSEGCISHREGQTGPIQRYIDNNDNPKMVFENVVGGYGIDYSNPIDSIKQADNDMMVNDVDQGNAHRDNILNPKHSSVSIGIAYNSNKLVLVQDFQEPLMPNWKNFDLSYDDSKSCW